MNGRSLSRNAGGIYIQASLTGWSFPENWSILNSQFSPFSLVQLILAIPQPDEAKTVVSRISEAIKAQIAERVYPSGSRLPSSRALAADLGGTCQRL
jgi:hypothetical protein